jgi:hypothetical protein
VNMLEYSMSRGSSRRPSGISTITSYMEHSNDDLQNMLGQSPHYELFQDGEEREHENDDQVLTHSPLGPNKPVMMLGMFSRGHGEEEKQDDKSEVASEVPSISMTKLWEKEGHMPISTGRMLAMSPTECIAEHRAILSMLESPSHWMSQFKAKFGVTINRLNRREIETKLRVTKDYFALLEYTACMLEGA